MRANDCLDKTKEIINGQRNSDYGDMLEFFCRVSKMWSVYLGIHVDPVDVPVMMVLFKSCRLAANKEYEDGPLDICGYGAGIAEVIDRRKYHAPINGIEACATDMHVKSGASAIGSTPPQVNWK
jgi:hypothetical protein